MFFSCVSNLAFDPSSAQTEERLWFVLTVSLELAGTCCAHPTASSTAVPLREQGGARKGSGRGCWNGTSKCFFVFFCKRWSRLRSSVVMLSREYSGGDRLSSYTALRCRKCTSKNVSQLQGSLLTLFWVKSDLFLALIPAFVWAKAGGVDFNTALIEKKYIYAIWSKQKLWDPLPLSKL